VGHRDVPGKPALFGTTPGFLEHFNLKSLSDLPPLSELRDLEEISRELNFSLDFGAAEAGEEEDEEKGETSGDSDDSSAMNDPNAGNESEVAAAPSGGGHE
jgi:segregation and condensation protein B